MSTATAFRYIRPFPFCPGASSPGANFDYVGGLSLADAMSWFWNTEDLSFTTSGTVNGVSIGGTFGLNPLTHTGAFDVPDRDSILSIIVQDWGLDSGWPGSSTPISPLERVCNETDIILSYEWGAASGTTYQFTNYGAVFYLRVDPGDATKYAIYYRFNFKTDLTLADAVFFRNPARGAPGSGRGLSITTGMIISGLTFDIYIYTKGPVGVGSPLLTASRGVYTY
jgi:hypothetical protein